ncbi:hypothetical protein AXJ14_gp023 [Geobacillus virus E3]|uniref:hypothetical protein n=1 Tax=Geobacillus virus E3 TaxID=1572712 RepID=UPI000671C4A1|nr:hypothetical protein AXJ14_gp023 [Geobacillus virus E3]AJA41342.1 hypothetical protein E3_023 [Geobacillus virus E3]
MISEMDLLKGKPINLGVCKVHPLTLNEIVDMTEEKYNQALSLITFNKSRLDIKDEELNQLTDYQILLAYCYHNPEIREIFFESAEIFLKEPIHIHELGFFYLGDLKEERIIDENIFKQIQEVVKKQNFLSTEQTEFKPANEKAAELIEKIKKVKEKLAKQNRDNELNLSDIVSIVACYSDGINLFNVWDLTVYQLYIAYLRLIMWDDYHTKYILLPHVTDSNSLDLKHWATKINLNKK